MGDERNHRIVVSSKRISPVDSSGTPRNRVCGTARLPHAGKTQPTHRTQVADSVSIARYFSGWHGGHSSGVVLICTTSRGNGRNDDLHWKLPIVRRSSQHPVPQRTADPFMDGFIAYRSSRLSRYGFFRDDCTRGLRGSIKTSSGQPYGSDCWLWLGFGWELHQSTPCVCVSTQILGNRHVCGLGCAFTFCSLRWVRLARPTRKLAFDDSAGTSVRSLAVSVLQPWDETHPGSSRLPVWIDRTNHGLASRHVDAEGTTQSHRDDRIRTGAGWACVVFGLGSSDGQSADARNTIKPVRPGPPNAPSFVLSRLGLVHIGGFARRG